jgi:large subunit ribosomal protein L13
MCWFLAKSEKAAIETFYVDASGKIAGRLCSRVAKLLLGGNSVVVLNADKALFSGSRSNVMATFFEKLKIASVVHPKHGPFHPRTPAGILSRMVRGMIPRSKPSGEVALRRLRVYEGLPSQYNSIKLTEFEETKATKPLAYYVPLGEVAIRIGWKGASAGA